MSTRANERARVVRSVQVDSDVVWRVGWDMRLGAEVQQARSADDDARGQDVKNEQKRARASGVVIRMKGLPSTAGGGVPARWAVSCWRVAPALTTDAKAALARWHRCSASNAVRSPAVRLCQRPIADQPAAVCGLSEQGAAELPARCAFRGLVIGW